MSRWIAPAAPPPPRSSAKQPLFHLPAFSLLAAALLAGAGCDKSCQNTCYRIYDVSECHVTVGGLSEKELKDTCIDECSAALKHAGAMGDYDPYNTPQNENPSLQNEKQAAAWMDCVWSADCSQLDPVGGICKPIP